MIVVEGVKKLLHAAHLRGPFYICLSFAVPAILCFFVYELFGTSVLMAWCFLMFVAVHLLFGEFVRRFDSVTSMRTGTASKQERFWYFMMVGANLTHYGVITHIHYASSQWRPPFNIDASWWINIHGLVTFAAIFSLVFFVLKPSVITEQGPSVEYREHGYWRMTKHPALMHLFLLFFLFFLEDPEFSNINLWFMLYLVIGIAHQNSRNSEALADKPNFDPMHAPRAIYEEFFEKPTEDCFISPKIDLLIVVLLSFGIWIGGNQLFFFAILAIVTVMSGMGCWYAYGLKVTNENFLDYRRRIGR